MHYLKVLTKNIIKKLKKNTNSEAIILLMSDHGSRDLAKGQKKYSSFNSFKNKGSITFIMLGTLV